MGLSDIYQPVFSFLYPIVHVLKNLSIYLSPLFLCSLMIIEGILCCSFVPCRHQSCIDSVCVCVKLIPHCSVLWYESALFMVVIVRVFGILVCCVQVLCGCVMSFKVLLTNKLQCIVTFLCTKLVLQVCIYMNMHYYSHNYYML